MFKFETSLLERLNKLAKIRALTVPQLIEEMVTEAEIETAYQIKQERDWAFNNTPKRSLQD